MVLAVIGGLFYIWNSIRHKKVTVSLSLLGGLFFVLLFNLICIYAEDYNNNIDGAYTTYIMSALTWLGAAYAVAQFIKMQHGEVNFTNITYYLAAVCAAQCIIAQLIDNYPAFESFVNSIFRQATDFYKDIDRLYGIGASLDPAGTRFAVVLMMITQVLVYISPQETTQKATIFGLLTCFFIIAVMGNMIARTTSSGLALSIVLFAVNAPVLRINIERKYLKLLGIFSILLGFTVAVATFFYNTDAETRGLIRFAFEGAFRYIEEGELRTASTDVLDTMWVWPAPEDIKTWIIGTGDFARFGFVSDVGYCRLIMYCGIVGFSAFALLHIYSGLAMMKLSQGFKLFFLLLIALSFIIWSKVATDLFQFYALFYCLDQFESLKTTHTQAQGNITL